MTTDSSGESSGDRSGSAPPETSLHPTAIVHATAIVHPGAVLGPECVVGPYSIIGPRVRMGARCRIGPHVVVDGNTTIGSDNTIYQFASVGSAPQDLKYRGEPSTLEIGDANIIREYATLQPGTEGGGMRTVIGSKNLFMVSSHVGHDCHIGDRNVFANSVALAGHVTIGSGVIVGGLAAVHQFIKVGDLALLGGGAMVTKDVAPFMTVQGDRAVFVGINRIGMERNGFPESDIEAVSRFYRDIFSSRIGGVFRERLAKMVAQSNGHPLISAIAEFIRSSERGILFPLKRARGGGQ